MIKKNDGLRKRRLAAIHVGKAALGMDDDAYRDLLAHLTAKRSAKECSDAELVMVLREFERRGFTGRKREFGQKPQVKSSKEAMMGKIEALLADSGLHWNYAVGIAKKMFGKEALEFCVESELYRIIAALEYQKKRRLRDGGTG